MKDEQHTDWRSRLRAGLEWRLTSKTAGRMDKTALYEIEQFIEDVDKQAYLRGWNDCKNSNTHKEQRAAQKAAILTIIEGIKKPLPDKTKYWDVEDYNILFAAKIAHNETLTDLATRIKEGI